MEKKLLERAKAFLNAHRKQNVWYRVMCVMASLVVFVTTYMLILPAITLEKDTYCGLEEHTHTEDCYQVLERAPERVLACDYETLQVHQHTDSCYDENHHLTCSRATYVIHTHDANCYNEDGILVCTLPEIKAHTHTDSCYQTEQALICGQQETAGHSHDSGCYTKERGGLICGAQEHTHGDGCFDADGQLICALQEHRHQDDCYQWNEALTCGQAEHAGHTHGAGCYETRKTLICGYDKLQVSAHQHSAGCFRTGTSEDVKVLSCGQTEHRHSEVCYQENAAELLEEQEAQNAGLLDEDGLIEDPDMDVPVQADGSLPEAGRAYGPDAAAEEETETDAETEPETEENSETEEISVETEIIEEAETEMETETESLTEEETEIITETETLTEAETEPVTETEALTEAETESVTETDAPAETETEFLLEGETENETEAETEIETEAGTEIETETESETETETETENLIETETETVDGGSVDTGWYMNGSSWCTVEKKQNASERKTAPARSAKRAAGLEAAGLTAKAETGGNQGVDFGPYITSTSIAKMVNGNWTESEQFTDGDQVRVQLRYSLPAGKVDSTNKVIYYQLPAGFAPNKEETGNVYNLGSPVGTYKIGQNGMIEITFNDSFATGESFNGTIFFEGFVTAVGTGDQNEVRFDGMGSVVTIVRNGSQYDISTAKTGTINTSALENGKTRVDYTINTASKLGTDGKVTIKDEFKQSTATASYVEDSFKIYLKDSNGNLSEITGFQPEISTNGEGYQTFEISGLPALYAGEEYILKYSADVSASNLDGSGSISNSAGSCFQNTWSWAWNSVELSKSWIKKEGWYDSNTNQITWNITVNEGKQDLSGYKLSDQLPDGLNVVDDSFTVIDSSGKEQKPETFGTLTVAANHESFEYAFKDGCKDTYILRFKTNAPEGNTTINNTAELEKGGDGYQSTGSVGVTHRDWDIGKWFNGESVSGDKTIYNWRSEITLPESPFNEFIYTDEIINAENSGNTDNHYGIAKELDTAIKERLALIDNNGNSVPFENEDVGFTIQYYDAAGTEISADDTETHIRKFTITVTPKNDSFSGRKITFEYPTIVDYSGMNVNDTWRFENKAEIPDHSTTVSHDYTKPKKFSKQGTQYLNGSPSYYDGDTTVSMTESGGKLAYRLLLRTERTENGEIHVTDTIPPGMTLSGGIAGVSVMRYGNDWYETEWSGNYSFKTEGNVTVTADKKEDGSTLLTIKIKGGYNANPEGAGCVIQIKYELSVADDESWKDLKQESKKYVNTATWGSESDDQTTEVTRTVEKVSKTGVQLDENGDTYVSGPESKASDKVKYTVVINPGAEDLDPYHDKLTLVDTLKCGDASLCLDELTLYQYDAETDDHIGEVIDRSQYTLKYDDSDETNKVMTLEVPDKRAMVLVYTYQLGNGVNSVSNAISLNGIYSTSDAREIATSNSGATVDRTRVVVYKPDSADYSVLLSGAKFQLEKRVYDSGACSWEKVGEYTTDGNGKIIFNKSEENASVENSVLSVNTLYRLTEITAPAGYLKSEKSYYFLCMDSGAGTPKKEEIKKQLEEQCPGLFTENGTDLSTVTRFFQSGGGDIYVPNDYNEVKVEKVWLDENGTQLDGEKESPVRVQLYRCTKHVNPADVTTVTVNFKEKGSNNAVQKQYRIAKDTAMSVTLKDKWMPSQLGTHLSVTAENCTAVLSVPDAAADNQQGTVVCTISQIQGNACTVNIEGSYIGNGLSDTFNGTEPAITVSDGEKVGAPVTLNSENLWSAMWNGLDQKADDGKDYYYYLEELNPDPSCEVVYTNNNGIQKGIITINNKWIAKEGELTIRKEWDDQDLVSRHEPITVELWKKGDPEGTLITTIELNADNDWIQRYVLKDADAEYYVKETVPAGYTVSYTYNGVTYQADEARNIPAQANGVVVIKNTIQTTSVSVEKKWVDESGNLLTDDEKAAWGLTEKEVSLHLYGTLTDVNGTKDTDTEAYKEFFDEEGSLKPAYRDLDCGAVKVSAATEWKAKWENLLTADEKTGTQYQYFVVEEGEEFTVQYENNGITASAPETERTVTVTNKIGKTSITVDKKWLDENRTDITDGTDHPEEITVQLYRSDEKKKSLSDLTDEEKCREAVTISAEEGWKYVWEDLEWKNADDKLYYYYVKEADVEGYKPEYDRNGVMEGTVSLSNVRIGTTELTIEKQWANRDGKTIEAPADVSEVTIQLMRETLPGSFEDNFAQVDIKIGDFSERLFVRKGATLKIYLKNTNWSEVAFGDASPTSAPEHKYEAIITENICITGNYNDAATLETEILGAGGSGFTPFGEPYTLNSGNSWSRVIDNLPKEGIEEGKLVTYAYSIQEIGVPSGYKVSYSNNSGVPAGTITAINTKNDTKIEVVKKWLAQDGTPKQPEDCEEIQVELWRAELSGSSEDLFADVSIELTKYGSTFYKEAYSVRKNSTIILKLSGVEKIMVGEEEISPTSVSDPVYTYQFTVTDSVSVKGAGDYRTEFNSIDIAYTGTDGNVNDELIETRTLRKPVDAENTTEWATLFEDLPKEGEKEGKPITYVYYVVEKGSPSNYLVSYKNNEGIPSGTITVENKEVDLETTELTINKKWLDLSGEETGAPTSIDHVDVQLYRAVADPGITVKFVNSDQIQVKPSVYGPLKPGSDFTFKVTCPWGYEYGNAITWGNLKVTADNNDIEGKVEADYKTFTFTISDIQESKVINIEIKNDHNSGWGFSVDEEDYTCDDSSAALLDQELYKHISILAAENWTTTVTGLPKSITDNGNSINYRYYVVESPVPGYTSSVENNDGIDSGVITITNKQTEQQKPSITVKKVWDDQGEVLTHENDVIEVELFKKGATENEDTSKGMKTLSADNNWSCKWENLEENAVYYVKEASVTGYTTKYEYQGQEYETEREMNAKAGADTTITVKNTRTTSITVTKKWFASGGSSVESKSGVTSVTFKLWRRKLLNNESVEDSDEEVSNHELRFDGDWSITIDSLPVSVTENGTTYTYLYYVKETAVDGEAPEKAYTVSYDNNNGVPSGEISIQNTDIATYTLPETGGSGTQPYTVGGLLLSAMACLLLYIQNKRRKEEGGSS